MNDPYKVLGVSPTASDEEIKKAYHNLAKKYHPDRYHGSDLADVASEKMKEVNAAYEQIQNERAGGGNRQSGSGYANAGNPYGGYYQNAYRSRGPRVDSQGNSGDELYARIRRCINAGQYDEAESLLDGIANEKRGAEWNFLYGAVVMSRGRYVDAQSYFDRACEKDPYNTEYKNARDTLRNHTQGYAGGYYTQQENPCGGVCSCCTTMMCADCCCSCARGC